MKLVLLALLLLAAALFELPLRAAPAPMSDAAATALRARFEARQRETRTWSAEFSQTLTMPGMRAPVVSTGTIRYRAPDALRTDFTKPAGEWVLAVGDRLFLQKPGKRVAEKSLREDSAGKPILALLGLVQGRPPEGEQHYEARVTPEEGSFVIVLTRKPGASNRLPARITNVLSEARLEIREVLVELPNGGSLRYAFRNLERNRGLLCRERP